MPSQPGPAGPETEAEFEANLIWLLRTAHANGVDVEGGWMDRKDSIDEPDWGIEIYEVAKRRRHAVDG